MNTIIYSTLIKGYAIAKDSVGALNCFETMKAGGFTPNIVTVNTLLDACHRAGATQSARKLYEQIGDLQLEPDRITFATMIKGFARHGCADEAVAMLEEMESKSLWPDHSIYNVIIDAATQQAEGPAPDAKAYEKLIFGCMRQQSADRAAELLLDACGVGKHGMANGKVQLDPSVIPRVVDGLATRGLAETHIAPLVQKLRAAGVMVPGSVMSATIRGVATEVKGKEQTKDAVDVPPWRRQRNNE